MGNTLTPKEEDNHIKLFLEIQNLKPIPELNNIIKYQNVYTTSEEIIIYLTKDRDYLYVHKQPLPDTSNAAAHIKHHALMGLRREYLAFVVQATNEAPHQ